MAKSSSSFLDEALALQSSKKKAQRKCQVKTVMDSLAKDAQIELGIVLDNMDIDSVTIATLLQKKGYEISKYGVRRHRNGDCMCNREVA